jgi:hypothetical protein
VQQNIRNDKKRPALLAARDARLRTKIEFQQSRRTGMSAVGNIFLGANGEANLDVSKPAKPIQNEVQRFSRCMHCGTEFEQASQFAFCGETLSVAGECKRAWNTTVRDSITKPDSFVPEPTPCVFRGM